MPGIEDEKPTAWADISSDGEGDIIGVEQLPPTETHFDAKSQIRTVIEYKYNDDGNKVKVTKKFKVEKQKVSKPIAKRKEWTKFGLAKGDPPGPNSANTSVGEEVMFQFTLNKDNQVNDPENDPLARLRAAKTVTCRICRGDHWTNRCPYKDQLQPIADAMKPDIDTPAADTGSSSAPSAAPNNPKAYVPPSKRMGADDKQRKGDSMGMNRRDDQGTIRVTNLPEDVAESDLQELFGPFGSIARIYLHKDRQTGQSRGFAFITFKRREDAERAITNVSGYGYDHLILNVQWAKPPGQHND